MSGSFFLSGGRKLWMTYRDAVEAVDLKAESHRSELVPCRNPHIIPNNTDHCVLADRREGLAVIMAYK